MSTSWVVVRLLLFLALADSALAKNFITRWFENQFPTYHVHIINGNDSPVWCHCKSGDDDLGDHELKKNEEFYFQFKSHVLKFTLFFCNCRWPSRNKYAGFEVFNAAKFAYHPLHCFNGQNCFWKLEDDGVYASATDKYYFYKESEWHDE